MLGNLNPTKIPAELAIPKGMDFQLLLKEGISKLETYTTSSWTDFNKHDPGITTLEALCFALTELGLQLNMDVLDLMESGANNTLTGNSTFFPHTEILTCSPLTIADYRKLLLDIAISDYTVLSGTIPLFFPIKGVWLSVIENLSPAFYLDRGNRHLSYETGEGITLKGLYEVQFEFNYHPDFGDINSSIIRGSFDVDENLVVGSETIQLIQTYNVDIAFPYWDEADNNWRSVFTISSIELELGLGGIPGEIRTLNNDSNSDFFTVIIVNPVAVVTDPLTQNIRLGVSMKITSPLINHHKDIVNAEVGFIKDGLESLITDSSLTGVVSLFNQKVNIAFNLALHFRSTLYQNRNLCEDFASFTAVRVQEIAVHADLELAAGADTDVVLSKVFFAIDQFFSPIVKRYSLEGFKEMESKKKANRSTADILEGPLLQHGFINTEDVKGGSLIHRVFVSDIINLILALNESPGWSESNQILGVRNLSLSNFINNQEINQRAYNCLALTQPEIYRPRLSESKSRISCQKQGRPVPFSLPRVFLELNKLKNSASLIQSEAVNFPPSPRGDRLPIGKYGSIQEDFPSIYHLGKNQLPIAASQEHIAEVKQFKGYLMLFEQILADFFAQTKNLSKSLSISGHELQSYHSQPLNEIPEAWAILSPSITSETDWPAFLSDPNNNYLNEFDEADPSSLYVSASTQTIRFRKFMERRGQLLSHLAGRFGEDLSMYIQQRIFAGTKPASTAREKQILEGEARQETLYDQTLFLKDYHKVSSTKPQGTNYRDPAQVWDTDQVSGIEKRIARALGIRSFRRRDLFHTPSVTEPDFQVVNDTIGGNTFFYFEYLANGINPLLRSIPYSTQTEAEDAIAGFALAGQRRSAYRYETTYAAAQGIRYVAHIHDNQDQRLASTLILSTENERAELIDSIILGLYEKYSGEGLFVLEHILLRPLIRRTSSTDSDYFLPLHLDDAEPIVVDPYSFRVSIFLPSGRISANEPPTPDLPERFGDVSFRQLAEKVIREEVPAHIKPYIFWLDRPDMEIFQNSLRTWLERLADTSLGTPSPLQAQQNLVSFLTPWMDLSA